VSSGSFQTKLRNDIPTDIGEIINRTNFKVGVVWYVTVQLIGASVRRRSERLLKGCVCDF